MGQQHDHYQVQKPRRTDIQLQPEADKRETCERNHCEKRLPCRTTDSRDQSVPHKSCVPLMAEILIGSDHACRSEENRSHLTPSRRWFTPSRLRYIKREHRVDKFDAFRVAIAPSHADLRAIRSSVCERSLPRSRRGRSILLLKKAAPVSLLDLF